ncbi:MAG: C40 family peptidase [Elusimicrobia bacterium]|nr:C40 family peptidase [Elusimicrobiota bacterium]
MTPAFSRPPYPSYTVVHAAPAQFRDANRRGIVAVSLAEGLFRLRNSTEGFLESEAVPALYPFRELIASANATLPAATAFSLELQVRWHGGAWSRWYRMGRFAPGGGRSFPGQKDAGASVEVDILRLRRSAEAFRYRVRLESEERGKSPVLRLVAVTYTAESVAASLESSDAFSRTPQEAFEYGVTPKSQMTVQADFARTICSPTSVGMVMDFWKRPIGTLEAARKVFDSAEEIYGNWFLNTAFAGAQGLQAHVLRLNSMEELEREVRSGGPCVVSLAFEKGELPGAPLDRTSGHLLVVRGFDRLGRVVVNDPAAPKAAQVRRVYPRKAFAGAWLRHQAGLAYRIAPLWSRSMQIGVPFADLRRNPSASKSGRPRRDPEQESQLLYGERVRVLRVRGEWAQVEAAEQPRWSPKRGWHFYPGWVSVENLLPLGQGGVPNAVVATKSAQVEIPVPGMENRRRRLSVGTRLFVLRWKKGKVTVLLPEGRLGKMEASNLERLNLLSEGLRRKRILRTARLFLGEKYFWGGRSVGHHPQASVDCSGLVSLSFRVAGMEVPRNAHDQYLRSRRLHRKKLRPGDLLFLTYKNSKHILHVMIYSGEGRIIEASGDEDMVREVSLREKFGRPWEELESGMDLNGQMLHLGTFF